eukprot:TRINITY_DN4317_c0_g1_i1.p1 TRINITY_DN4317_c0_g1~~TRINITY_DN4317_c0_g1_i1.p1  ORF type:complete len:614 (-),score=142.22 TRINITY_DN4317_c0_g1_i1:76-1917(-)
MVIGPAWTRGEIEKPQGTKDMGSWKAAVYTPEQQQRLGVDESGNKRAPAPAPAPMLCGARAPMRSPMCGAIGPAWTRGEIERPHGTKDMGGWTAGVYTPEQQQRLGVDESGNKRAPSPAPAPMMCVARAPMCGAIGPAWTRGEIERPQGTKDMGGWTAGVYTPEQQQRLGVDESGNKRAPAPAPAPMMCGARAPMCGAIGPAWTRGEIERPQGTKDMGGWTAGVYTAEQQARLGVDEMGNKLAQAPAAAAQPAACRAIGPAWTRGEIEKPQGTKDMGGWTSLVYTQEQQERLGVDEQGNVVAKDEASPEPAPPLTISPQYAAALLNAPKLCDDMCAMYFKRYDTNNDQALQVSEITRLCTDLHLGLGMTIDVNEEAVRGSIAGFTQRSQEDRLTLEEFREWFTSVLQESISVSIAGPEPDSADAKTLMSVKVKALSGKEAAVEATSDMTFGELKSYVAQDLELPEAQSQLTLDGQVVPDSLTLGEAQLGPDAEIHAVVANIMKVKRHVYNMRGGAPPYRGYHLVASDEVELYPDTPMGEQMDKLAVDDGYPGHRMGGGPVIQAFQASASGKPPSMWEGGFNQVDIDDASTARDLFGMDGSVHVAVLVPMRGMD